MPKYDPDIITSHFENPDHDEWGRLDKDPIGKVQFYISNHYLKKYIKKGDRVLEIGPGPGRFTIELAKIGAKLALVDISENQLRLNREKLQEVELEETIEWRKKRDIVDLEGIPDNSFDSVVCYGGPLSYVFEFIDQAIQEVLRVTKSGGIILTSVMSTLGTFHHLINNVFDMNVLQKISLDRFDEATMSGDLLGDLAGGGTHQCHMFRYSELQEILLRYPIEILDTSASNFLSSGIFNEEALMNLTKDPEKWNMFLKWELDFCKEPGAIDAG
ncbi:MAG: class I SAM-dependent methyltransferase, partial [Candidatus Thorarchaeota archaeon]